MKPLAQNTLIQNRYLIVQLIGKGGMGEVYLAVDQRLGSAVAIKRTFFAGDETLGNAFEREARVLARLRHPVLPKVSDHFIENDQQYLVMEHISGDDLAKRLELLAKPFPLSWVMFWADQLLDALAYLHSHEPPIVHRDIKPQNLKLTDENHIILLDFGLSKSSTGQTNISGEKSGSGSTGSVVGYTPHYAPMEQIRGIGTSARSDIYSLSATLYQLMTNTVPVDALSRADAMLNGSPDPLKSPSEINPEIPPSVSGVILKGMEVSQERRYQSAKEMQKLLRKAYSDMQQAMSAKTVVITGSPAPGPASADDAFQATEVMDHEAMRAISNPIGDARSASGFSDSISQPHDAAAFGSTPESAPDTGGIRQADVKTEVFLAGSNQNPTSFEQNAPVQNQTIGTPAEAQSNEPANFAPTSDFSTFGQDKASHQASEPYSPVATMPYVALNDPASASQSQEQFANTGQSPSIEELQPKSAAVEVKSAPSVRSQPVQKKSSTGKYIAILAALFVVLLIVLAAAGGGIYYYTNYMHSGLLTEPTPTPEESPEPTPFPTPEETPQIAITDDNSNISPLNTDSDANNNSAVNSTSSLPTPTPEPALPKDDRLNTPGPAQPKPDRTPKQQTTPKTPKPGPTKKPGSAPDILQ
ncbi:MAG: serine/threonine protein kinase [Pyrinomonadaceae bacterium]